MTTHTQFTNEALSGVDEATTNTAAAVNAGLAAAGPRTLVNGSDRFFTQLVPAGGALVTFDVEELEEKYRDRPRRKTGTVRVHTADSFIDYLKKHTLPETEVWADLAGQQLVGVINAHQEADSDDDAIAADKGAGYGDHRVQLELIKTEPWKAWVEKDRRWLAQAEFAEHLEDQALDIVNPDAATMLEIAEHFQATTSADFKSGARLHSGQVTLRYEETGGAKAGENGDIDIPTVFDLELQPFEGAKVYVVQARFRYRLRGSELLLSYNLVNPTEVLRQAFVDYVEAVTNEITAPVFRGRPA